MPVTDNILEALGTSQGRKKGYPNATPVPASNSLAPAGAAGGNDGFAKLLEVLKRATSYQGFDIGALLKLLDQIGGGGGGSGGGGGGGGSEEEENGGGCLVGETLIRMADGSEKPISELKVHDSIMGFDPMLGDVAQTVESTWSSCQPCKVVMFAGQRLTEKVDDSGYGTQIVASRTHQWVLPNRGTITTDNLQVEDEVHGENATNKMVIQIADAGPQIVFWLACTPNHCYYAGGVLHHNAWYDNPKLRPRQWGSFPGPTSTPVGGGPGGGGGPA